jgi:hypothetical protein
MTPDSHRSRKAAATAEAREALVDLLVGHIGRAYDTSGQPGALSAVRDLFRRMDAKALTALIYELGLETEPVAEDGPEKGRQ